MTTTIKDKAFFEALADMVKLLVTVPGLFNALAEAINELHEWGTWIRKSVLEVPYPVSNPASGREMHESVIEAAKVLLYPDSPLSNKARRLLFGSVAAFCDSLTEEACPVKEYMLLRMYDTAVAERIIELTGDHPLKMAMVVASSSSGQFIEGVRAHLASTFDEETCQSRFDPFVIQFDMDKGLFVAESAAPPAADVEWPDAIG